MRFLAQLFALFLLALTVSARPALGAWPSDWLFLKAEEGWFFYKDPPPPSPPEILPNAPSFPVEGPPEASASPSEPPEGETTTTSKNSGALTDTLHAAPTSGPQLAGSAGSQLESWLLAVSDRDLEGLVATAPAAALRAWIPILLDQAITILDRTAVRKYLLAHRESLRRSERFSKLWQEVIWTDPSFDRPDHLPTGAMAQAIYEQEISSRRATTLAALRERVSLLVVVGPECAACEAQWKILQSWSAESGFTVRPIAKELFTLGDSALALPYPGVIDQLAITQLPSLYLVEPRSGGLIRLGSGLLTQDEIMTRILKLVPTDNPQQKGDLQHVSDRTTPRETARARDK